MRSRLAISALLLATTASAQPTPLYPEPKPNPPPVPPSLVQRQPKTFFSIALGSGTGVIGGETEGLEADVKTGFQWAPLHVRAEIAAFRSQQLAIGVVARVGFPFPDTDVPAAKAIMLRGYKMCDPLGLRFSVTVGAGYIRYRAGVDGTLIDTMVAGPILAGGGVGYVIPISKSWRFTVDIHAIAAIATSDKYGGVPNHSAMHLDLDVGLAVFR